MQTVTLWERNPARVFTNKRFKPVEDVDEQAVISAFWLNNGTAQYEAIDTATRMRVIVNLKKSS